MTIWTDLLNDDPTDWLLDAEPWTRYRTLIDLLDRPGDDSDVIRARAELVKHPLVRELIDRTTTWFPVPAKRHDDPKLSHYALTVLAEFGLTVEDAPMGEIADLAEGHIDDRQLAIRAEVPRRSKPADADGPSDAWAALPCDAPLVLYDLLLMGRRGPVVDRALDDLVRRWNTDTGWFCHLFFVESQFEKLGLGCPMAGLMALQVFSLVEGLQQTPQVANAFAALQSHRDAGRNVYYFGRSDRFWTFKYPFVWYNALYLADVVTRFPTLRSDPLTVELVDWIERSQDDDGRFRPTSMFRAYSAWEFADKKQPSPWITFLCCRILRRYHGSS